MFKYNKTATAVVAVVTIVPLHLKCVYVFKLWRINRAHVCKSFWKKWLALILLSRNPLYSSRPHSSIHQFKFTIYANKRVLMLCTHASIDVPTCVCLFIRVPIDALHFQIDLLDFTTSFCVCSLHSLYLFMFVVVAVVFEMSNEHRHEIMHGAAFQKCVRHMFSPSLSSSLVWKRKKLIRFLSYYYCFDSDEIVETNRIRLSAFMRILYENKTVDTYTHTTKHSEKREREKGKKTNRLYLWWFRILKYRFTCRFNGMHCAV